MNEKFPVVITVPIEKSDEVRNIASKLSFSYEEKKTLSLNLLSFHFSLSLDDSLKLAAEIPVDVYAYSATIGELP
jgi:hypothetical protein